MTWNRARTYPRHTESASKPLFLYFFQIKVERIAFQPNSEDRGATQNFHGTPITLLPFYPSSGSTRKPSVQRTAPSRTAPCRQPEALPGEAGAERRAAPAAAYLKTRSSRQAMSAAVRAQAPMTAAFSAERSRSSAGTGLSWARLRLPAAPCGSAGRRLPFTAGLSATAGGSRLPRASGSESSRQAASSSSSGHGERILPGYGRHRAEPRKAAAALTGPPPERRRLPSGGGRPRSPPPAPRWRCPRPRCALCAGGAALPAGVAPAAGVLSAPRVEIPLPRLGRKCCGLRLREMGWFGEEVRGRARCGLRSPKAVVK